MEVAAVNGSASLKDEDLAFYVKGCNEQLEECARAWGVPFTPVALYRTADRLPAFDIRVATFVDELPEAPGAAAYHTITDDGSVLSKMDAAFGCQAFSHENVEELINPGCDKTARRPDGALVDLEIADPVQGDARMRPVAIMGETRDVEESNYVLPSWFDPAGAAPFDAFGLCTRPFEVRPGGYCVVDGVPVFSGADLLAAKAVAEKQADPGSRLNRRAP